MAEELTFTEEQVQGLLLELTEMFADAAGFRKPYNGERSKDFRKEFIKYLNEFQPRESVETMSGELQSVISVLTALKASMEARGL